MAMRIEKPEDTSRLNMLIYGTTGVGKTHLAGTAQAAESMSPALLVDVESGSATLRGVDIDVTRPRSWDDIQEVYNTLYDGGHGYQTVIVDSLTEVQKRISLGSLKGDLDATGRFKALSAATPTDMQDWLRTSEHMHKFIKAFRDLAYHDDPERRINVIMIALERTDQKKHMVYPDMSGQTGLGCGAWVDVLARLSYVDTTIDEDGDPVPLRKPYRHLLLEHYTDRAGFRYLAKNRGNRLGKQIKEPTMAKMLQLWNTSEPAQD